MPSLSIELLALPVSTAIALIVIYYKFSVVQLQQIALVLMIVLLIFHRFFLSNANNFSSRLFKSIVLLAISLFVQIWVISSGGIKSPFLILFHLTALGLAFLVNLPASISFLLFSLATLSFYTWSDQTALEVFQSDLGTSLLLSSSFIVITPLSILISRYYYLKDKLLEILKKELRLKDIQQQEVLRGISELVFIVDKDLKIISINESVERELFLSKTEIMYRPLMEVLFLKDANGKMVNVQPFSIEQVIKDKHIQIIDDLMLVTRNKARPKQVKVQIIPNTNLEGKVDRITILISDLGGASKIEQKHTNFEEVKTKYQAMIEDIKSMLVQSNLPELKTRVDLVGKIEQDLLTSVELEDHVTKPNYVMMDVAALCKKVVASEQEFAKELGVNLSFKILNFGQADIAPLVPKGFPISPDQLTGPFFTAPLDIGWFDLLIHKLLDLVILLTSTIKDANVSLNLEREGTNFLVISLISNFVALTTDIEKELFTPGYGSLTNTNLRFGSGLEGMIAKIIAAALNIPLSVELGQTEGLTAIKLKIGRSLNNNLVR